jgi:predicted lysophospholipase L1 biosynthesis ABC-type transport system permease subunit
LSDMVVTPPRRTLLLGLLGGLGLLLTLVGISSMTAYAVARRTQEIGIRMAFGANTADVILTIMRDAAWPALLGVSVGMAAAFYATRNHRELPLRNDVPRSNDVRGCGHLDGRSGAGRRMGTCAPGGTGLIP